MIHTIQDITKEFMKKDIEFNWNNISRYQYLSIDFIEKYWDKLNKELISMWQKLSIEFIEKHYNELDKELIIKYQKLPNWFKEKYGIFMGNTNMLLIKSTEIQSHTIEDIIQDISNILVKHNITITNKSLAEVAILVAVFNEDIYVDNLTSKNPHFYTCTLQETKNE